MNPFRAIALVMMGLLLATSLQAQPSSGSWKKECGCYRNVVWGTEHWVDTSYPVGRQKFKHDMDFWPVTRRSRNQPLIIWAHAGGGTKFIPMQSNPEDPTLFDRVVAPARAAGFAVASIEYRHPVHNDDIVPPPHQDIGLAVQGIRAMATELGIDPDNIFLMGGSQGTLVVWQGVQPDMQQPGAGGSAAYSSRANAVYAYNAQATFRGQQIADMFLVPEDREAFVADWQIKHPQEALFGSTVSDVTADATPLMLKYERRYFHRLALWDELTVHHPDFGLAVCDAYANAGIADRCQTAELVPKVEDYADAIDFFRLHLKTDPAAAARRASAR